jgi:endo-1,4-beta-xylanase
MHVLSIVLAVLPVALAQSPVWGQCGGNGWTGATTCTSGNTCVVVK